MIIRPKTTYSLWLSCLRKRFSISRPHLHSFFFYSTRYISHTNKICFASVRAFLRTFSFQLTLSAPFFFFCSQTVLFLAIPDWKAVSTLVSPAIGSEFYIWKVILYAVSKGLLMCSFYIHLSHKHAKMADYIVNAHSDGSSRKVGCCLSHSY